MGNVRNRVFNTVGTPNCLVFLFVVFDDKSEVLWSGSFMSVGSSSTEVALSNFFGS